MIHFSTFSVAAIVARLRSLGTNSRQLHGSPSLFSFWLFFFFLPIFYNYSCTVPLLIHRNLNQYEINWQKRTHIVSPRWIYSRIKFVFIHDALKVRVFTLRNYANGRDFGWRPHMRSRWNVSDRKSHRISQVPYHIRFVKQKKKKNVLKSKVQV